MAGVGKSLQSGTWYAWLLWGFGQSFMGAVSLTSGEERVCGHSHCCSSAPAYAVYTGGGIRTELGSVRQLGVLET